MTSTTSEAKSETALFLSDVPPASVDGSFLSHPFSTTPTHNIEREVPPFISINEELSPTPKHKPTATGKKTTTTKNKSKKDDGKPRRALTAYNLFFAMERKRILAEQKSPIIHKSMRNKYRIGKHANVGFANLARIVGEKWRKVDAQLKMELERQAKIDKERYNNEMKEWNLKEKMKTAGAMEDCIKSLTVGAKKKVQSSKYNTITPADFTPTTTFPQAQSSNSGAGGSRPFPSLPFAVSTVDFCAPCTPRGGAPSNVEQEISFNERFGKQFEAMYQQEFNASMARRSSMSSTPRGFMSAGYDHHQQNAFSCMPCSPANTARSMMLGGMGVLPFSQQEFSMRNEMEDGMMQFYQGQGRRRNSSYL